MSDLPKHLSYASDLQAGDKFRVNSSHVWKQVHQAIIHVGFVELDAQQYTSDTVFHVQRKPETVEVDKAEYEKLQVLQRRVERLAKGCDPSHLIWELRDAVKVAND